MATPLDGVAFFFLFFFVGLLNSNLLVPMYRDLRIRNSNRPTPVPRSHKAYIFYCNVADAVVYKVILAPSLIIAWQRVKDFSRENDLDVFWQFRAEDDFEVAYSNDLMIK